GILCAAMVQLAIATAAGIGTHILVAGFTIPSLALDVGLVSAAFFVLGVLFYSFFYAAIGATVSRQSEASTAAMPLTILLLVPYGLSLVYIPTHPDATLSRILSLLPLTATIAMPAR